MNSLGTNGIIVLLTDFGLSDDYVGQVKGAILKQFSDARIIDLCHDVPSFDPGAASFILSKDYMYFPAGSVFMCVIDPGVGTDREIKLMEFDNRFFIAPDNGLLSDLVIDEEVENYKLYRLKCENFIDEYVSSTFHGRDIFAGLAAELASSKQDIGERFERISSDEWIRIIRPGMEKTEKFIEGNTRYIDKYGNIITDIPAKYASSDRNKLTVSYKTREMPLCRTFANNNEEIFAIYGSKKTIEIVSNQQSAANILNARLYERVRLNFK